MKTRMLTSGQLLSIERETHTQLDLDRGHDEDLARQHELSTRAFSTRQLAICQVNQAFGRKKSFLPQTADRFQTSQKSLESRWVNGVDSPLVDTASAKDGPESKAAETDTAEPETIPGNVTENQQQAVLGGLQTHLEELAVKRVAAAEERLTARVSASSQQAAVQIAANLQVRLRNLLLVSSCLCLTCTHYGLCTRAPANNCQCCISTPTGRGACRGGCRVGCTVVRACVKKTKAANCSNMENLDDMGERCGEG